MKAEAGGVYSSIAIYFGSGEQKCAIWKAQLSKEICYKGCIYYVKGSVSYDKYDRGSSVGLWRMHGDSDYIWVLLLYQC